MTPFTFSPNDTVESLDVRGLAYVGPDPTNSGADLFVGPYGLPFEILLADTTDNRGNQRKVLFLHGLALTMPANGINGSISLSTRMQTIVCTHMTDAEVEALPTDPRARAEALRDIVAAKVEPQTPVTERGTLDEMCRLLQAWSSLTKREFRVMSATGKFGEPRIIRINGSDLWWDAPAAIARWHKPVATAPSIKDRPLVDQRVPTIVADFKPEVLSGHDKLEALVAVKGWLVAHYHEIPGRSQPIEEVLAEIGETPDRDAA